MVETDRLSNDDLKRLRPYLSRPLHEALTFEAATPPPQLLQQALTRLAEVLETTSSHLPAYLVEAVTREPRPGLAGGHFMPGTLLFADISGFTAMSEKLSRIGREGAEEVTAIINRYFAAMLELLRQHQGQLIKFGGDALLGLFPEAGGGSAARAAQAARQMQIAMRDFAETRTSQGTFPLQMKVSLRRGQFFAAYLGSEQSMEYALFGRDVNATAAGESAATAGQVLVDADTLRAIEAPHRASPAAAGYFNIDWIEPAQLSAESPRAPFALREAPPLEELRRITTLLEGLTPFLPTGLLARLSRDTRSLSLQGEHRLVAVLFANIEGLGALADALGPGREPDIIAGLQDYFVAMNSAIHKYGGVINKLDLYDHGDKLLAFFGAPVAHEDDAERAVRAAQEMQKELTEAGRRTTDDRATGLSQRIGLSYGYVFAGYVGADWRHEYTVMGDQVNLAARLMSAAEPGSVTVSDDVRRKVQALFEFDPRGEVRLKGKANPYALFQVARPRAVPEPLRGLQDLRSPLVGRAAEWASLRSAFENLSIGRGQIVSIMGEAGLGKSRLVAELRQHLHAQRAQITWVDGRCLSYTESSSFYPFLDLIRSLLALRSDDGDEVQATQVQAAVQRLLAPDEAATVLPFLLKFLDLPLDEALQARVKYLDAEGLQRRIFVALSRLLEAYAQITPLILTIDDLHWLDQASLALLEYLMPLVDRAPVMLLLLYRAERAKGCWRIHEKAAREFAHRNTQITLDLLAPEATGQLLANLIRMEDQPAPFRDLILKRAEGNPLYVEEVLRVLIDRGALTREAGGAWRISGDLTVLDMPDTLQGVLMARLDQLEEPARQTAQIAAVVGRVFAFDLLLRILPEQQADLPPQLVELQQHDIASEHARVPELRYAFRHPLLQEVCYHTLLARTRRQYHSRIAAQLEQRAAAGLTEAESVSTEALIAHHAYFGQDWPRALRYQTLAGQEAQQFFANHEAIDHFTKALESAEHLPPAETEAQRQSLALALGEALVNTSQYDLALEQLQQGQRLAQARGDADAQTRASRWIARVHELRGDYAAAFDSVEQGLAVLAGRETRDSAESRLTAGLIHIRQGEYEKAREAGEIALQVASALNELKTVARANNHLGVIDLRRGRTPAARDYFQQALVVYQHTGDIQGQAVAHNQLANAHFNTGNWPEADHHYRRAREMFDQIGDRYNRAFADNNLGGLALNQGRFEEALQFYQGARRSFEQIGASAFVMGAVTMNVGATLIRQRDLAGARAHLEKSLGLFEQAQARDFLPEAHRHLARVALIAGDPQEAEAQAQQALTLARDLSIRSEEGCALRVLGEIYNDLGRAAEAEALLTQSVSILEEVADEYELARSRFSLARAHSLLNQPTAARAQLDQCLPIFERLEAAPDLTAARALQAKLA